MEKAVDKNQTIDETKRKLKSSRETLEGELEIQLQDIKKDAVDIGKQVAIVGGGLFLGWKLVKALTGKKKDKRKGKKKGSKHHAASSNSGNGAGLGKMLLHQIMTMVSVAVTDQIKQALKQNKAVNDNKKNS